VTAARQGGRGAIRMMAIALWVGLAAASSGAAETDSRATAPGSEIAELRLRTGEHDGYSRLVFDWAAPVGYRVEQGPGRAVLHFDRPARLDLSRFRAGRPKLVSGAQARPTAAGLTVELTLPPGVGLRHFLSGPKVVLDVLAPRAAAGSAGSGATPETSDAGAAQAADESDGAAPKPAKSDADATRSKRAETAAAKPGQDGPAARPTRLQPGKRTGRSPPVPPRSAKSSAKPSDKAPVKAPTRPGAKLSFTFERSELPPLRPIPGAGAPRYRPTALPRAQ